MVLIGVKGGKEFGDGVRSHWEVENKLHWSLDVTFREDDSRVRKGHGAQNFGLVRKVVLSLLRKDTRYPKRSLRGRRKTAERKPEYRSKLLNLLNIS